MAISRGQVTLDEAPVIDKRLQTVTRTDGGTSDTIHNEVFCLISPNNANDTAICEVLNAAPTTEYGLVVRNIPSGTQNVADGGGSITVDAVALDTRLLTVSDTVRVVGKEAHDAAITADPVLLAGYGSTATPGAVSADGDVTRIWVDRNGRVQIADGGGLISIDDGAGTITVDAPVGTPVFVRLSDGAATLIGQKTMANSLPVAIASDQSSIPVDLRRGQTLKFASISAATSGNNTLVAAGTNKIKVVSYVIVADGTVTATFQSGAGGTGLSGAMALVANSGVAISATPGSWLFETAAATLLNLSLSAAIGVRGHISYIDEA